MASDYTPTGALTTRDNVTEYLGGTWDATANTLLDNLILATTKQFEVYTRRQLLSAAITSEKYDGPPDSDVILLRQYPVTAVSAVTEDGTALSASDYEIDGTTGELYRKASTTEYTAWAEGRRNIVVTYTAGYVDAPSDLCFAATVHVAWMYKRTRRLGERQQVITPDVSGIYMVDAMAPEVIDILDRYRSVRQ